MHLGYLPPPTPFVTHSEFQAYIDRYWSADLQVRGQLAQASLWESVAYALETGAIALADRELRDGKRSIARMSAAVGTDVTALFA